MIAQIEKTHYTPEEYLELEIASDERHEYNDGEIILMTGGTPNHNKLALSFGAMLLFSLKRQPYEVFATDQRLWVPRKRIYAYPDVMVMAQPISYAEGRRDTLIDPILIAEVLSPSTRNYDRGDKFIAYRTIPTFQEYLLIEQSNVHIEHYFKTATSRWTFVEYEDIDLSIPLQSIGCDVAIADLYDKVEFEITEDPDRESMPQ
ncbi:Uma2 family endonuclease [Pseudanabaena sp. PCC 6802]|uniref:Uma2 family endonuclease n=1 Tax=Pseudanabaena sp. PCC 6802 TaxID=118173 RepID=UPI0003449309|nr:Uma2 family endonuclease [Pseudanabaena sp. PCC 6802]